MNPYTTDSAPPKGDYRPRQPMCHTHNSSGRGEVFVRTRLSLLDRGCNRIVRRGCSASYVGPGAAPVAGPLAEDPGTGPWRGRESDDYETGFQPTYSLSPGGGLPRALGCTKPGERTGIRQVASCLCPGTTAWRQRTLPPGCHTATSSGRCTSDCIIWWPP